MSCERIELRWSHCAQILALLLLHSVFAPHWLDLPFVIKYFPEADEEPHLRCVFQISTFGDLKPELKILKMLAETSRRVRSGRYALPAQDRRRHCVHRRLLFSSHFNGCSPALATSLRAYSTFGRSVNVKISIFGMKVHNLWFTGARK